MNGTEPTLQIDVILFKKRCLLLDIFLIRSDFKLECLHAIQSLDHRTQHMPNFIPSVFRLLYDQSIINEDLFLKWKRDEREEGHAISVFSLKAFFEWLSIDSCSRGYN